MVWEVVEQSDLASIILANWNRKLLISFILRAWDFLQASSVGTAIELTTLIGLSLLESSVWCFGDKQNTWNTCTLHYSRLYISRQKLVKWMPRLPCLYIKKKADIEWYFTLESSSGNVMVNTTITLLPQISSVNVFTIIVTSLFRSHVNVVYLLS